MEQQKITSQWYYSLQFRIVAIFLALFLMILVAVLVIGQTLGENLVREHAYQKISDAGHHVVAELEKRTNVASTIAKSIAEVSTQIPSHHHVFSESIRKMMDFEGVQDMIAGGGIWPEPFAFDPHRERNSFFWGRDKHGDLIFYDNYNIPEGSGYHEEEWYVPTKYLRQGGEYWSRSYIDRVSQQPMVTVSVPLFKNNKNIGAATVDLKLDGLQKLFERVAESFGGYAFAVDRNGRFLSFPDDNMAKTTTMRLENGSLVPYIHISELAKKNSAFKPFEALINQQRARSIAPKEGVTAKADLMAKEMSESSYKIKSHEARFIAASLLRADSDNLASFESHSRLDADYFLQEPAYVSITTMANTYWQIVTVMPSSESRQEAVILFNQFVVVISFAIFIAMILAWFLVRNQLTLPLMHLSKQLSDMFNDNNELEQNIISSNDRGELGALSHWFNLRTQQLITSKQEVERLAFYDSLTGLPNRRMMLDRLSEKVADATRNHNYGAVLFLDLDQFKHINDSLGHNIGDELLVQVGQRLSQSLRKQDLLARIGGDEFVIVLTTQNVGKSRVSTQAYSVARKIIDMFAVPFHLNGNQYYVTVSIGISLYPEDDGSVEDLLKQADTAMYQAKNNGRNTYCFFEPAMQARVDERLRIEKELREAIVSNSLTVYYQPQVDANGVCQGAEALLRWPHPSKGMVSPAEFIHIAEDSALIELIGTWVFNEVCRQIKIWEQQKLPFGRISVNLSARQLQRHNCLLELQQALDKHNVQPGSLLLEITEDTIAKQSQEVVAALQGVKEVGVKIAVDNFGAGYTSLKYLKELPVCQLKVDQSLVRDITLEDSELSIVEAIIILAKHLELEIIAEGVETQEQFELLLKRGCKLFQGFYFEQPLKADEFSGYLLGH